MACPEKTMVTAISSRIDPNYYLIFFLSGSWAQSPVLTQISSVSASPGSSARITCTLSSGFKVPGYHIFWYQQKTESVPQFLLRYYSDSDKYQGPGVPSRFSGSKDASANAGILLISGLQPEDEAAYSCATYHIFDPLCSVSNNEKTNA
uniref:Ig-like domain-containing protein n=1 Tax=Castor canadensis TaxID=51338 RepID=A0A8C0ZMY8_CASCN